MDELSGEEPGYVPPDHKTTAEFRVSGRPAEPAPATEPRPDATAVDEPVDDPVDPGVTSQDVTPEAADPGVTFTDDPDVTFTDDPGVTFADPPVDDPEDNPEDDVPDDAADPEDHASVTVSDIRVPPKAMAFAMPGHERAEPGPAMPEPGHEAPEPGEAVPEPGQAMPASGQEAPDPATVPDEIPEHERAGTAERAESHEQAPPPPAGAPAAGPVAGEAPWTEQFGAGAEPAGGPGGGAPDPAHAQAHAYAPPSPPGEATAPAMARAVSPSGGVPPAGPSGSSRSGRPLLVVALIAIVVLLAIVAIVMLLMNRGSETEGKAAPTPSSATSAPASAGPAPGEPSPSGAPGAPQPSGTPPSETPGQPSASQAPAAPSQPVGPVLDGDGITYQLVQQSEGYFEGKLVITNRTGRPMPAWRLTFRVPGAVVKNIWGARLVTGGESAEITNLDGARAIPPGGTWDVQFGASGATSTPKGCMLNGEPCGF